MTATNGTTTPAALSDLARAERFVVHAGELLDRMFYARRLGTTYDGARDVYETLGWKRHLTYNDFRNKYDRQDVAGRIVDLPVDATWRDGFQLRNGLDED